VYVESQLNVMGYWKVSKVFLDHWYSCVFTARSDYELDVSLVPSSARSPQIPHDKVLCISTTLLDNQFKRWGDVNQDILECLAHWTNLHARLSPIRFFIEEITPWTEKSSYVPYMDTTNLAIYPSPSSLISPTIPVVKPHIVALMINLTTFLIKSPTTPIMRSILLPIVPLTICPTTAPIIQTIISLVISPVMRLITPLVVAFVEPIIINASTPFFIPISASFIISFFTLFIVPLMKDKRVLLNVVRSRNREFRDMSVRGLTQG
jgi:hypothetical protein